MNKRQGFTLVELLAVIVILAIILVIAIPNIMKIIEKAKLDAYKRNEELLINATRNYLAGNPDKAPINVGEIKIVNLTDLQAYNIIENIKDVKSNSNCIGQITVTKKNSSEYSYDPYIECGSNYKTLEYVKDGLIIYLDGFDAPVGNLWKDRSGNNNDATISNATYDSLLKGYKFVPSTIDGTNDLMTVSFGNGINPNGYSISVLAKLNSTLGSQTFISTATATNQRFYMGIYNSLYDTGIQTSVWGTTPTSGTRPSATNGTVLLTTQYDNGLAKFFLNNQYQFSKSYTTYTLATNFSLGYLVGSAGYYLDGNIYNVKIYNRVLSSDELLNNYNIDKLKYGF
jgi:prepilin-type N-terminal cleavage/methylation domain-containing protein